MKLRVYNKTLEPNLWTEENKLKPEVRKSLFKIAKDFYDSTDLKGDIEDILFLGSSANYNWTPASDVDLHILIDITKEKINPEYVRKIMDNFGFKWNTQHEDIRIKGHKVEVYLQDVGDKNRSVGVYSLLHDEWVHEPKREEIQLDKDLIKKKYHQIKDKIDTMSASGQLDKLKDLMKSITAYREAGLSKEGEFSNENIVFKALRQFGDLKKLKDSITQLYDKNATLKESTGGSKIWVGYVDDDYNVNSISSNTEALTHTQIPGYRREFHKWRWREGTDFIFWWGEVHDDIKQVVSDYIRKKTGKIINKHRSNAHASDNLMIGMHDPNFKLKVAENKHNPFKEKKMEFVTYGGLSLTKQKGFTKNGSFHQPPARKGIYAFVWPYIEKFLLGGDSLVDPKIRGKGQRQRISYVKDKEGNVVNKDHPDYKKLSSIDNNWSLKRPKPGVDVNDDNLDWNEKYDSLLYNNNNRRKFSYNGPIWHHLVDYVKDENVLDRNGSWVKTDMDSFREAFKKELHSMSKSAMSYGMLTSKLRKGFALDHLEVFIDTKI